MKYILFGEWFKNGWPSFNLAVIQFSLDMLVIYFTFCLFGVNEMPEGVSGQWFAAGLATSLVASLYFAYRFDGKSAH